MELADGEFFAFNTRGLLLRVPQPQSLSPSSSASSSSSSSTSSSSFSFSASPTSPMSPICCITDAASPTAIKLLSLALPVSPAAAVQPSPLTSTDTTGAIDALSSPLLIPQLAFLTPSPSLPLPPSPPTAEVTVAARLAYQLADMHTEGRTVTHTTMDALFDDHCPASSTHSLPFIRLLPTAQFACLPLPLDAHSRALLVCEPFDGLPICADIEAETGVDVYVPPLPSEVDGDGVLCNVQFNVVVVGERSVQQLEDAVLRMLMRWEAVQQYMAKQKVNNTLRVPMEGMEGIEPAFVTNDEQEGILAAS